MKVFERKKMWGMIAASLAGSACWVAPSAFAGFQVIGNPATPYTYQVTPEPKKMISVEQEIVYGSTTNILHRGSIDTTLALLPVDGAQDEGVRDALRDVIPVGQGWKVYMMQGVSLKGRVGYRSSKSWVLAFDSVLVRGNLMAEVNWAFKEITLYPATDRFMIAGLNGQSRDRATVREVRTVQREDTSSPTAIALQLKPTQPGIMQGKTLPVSTIDVPVRAIVDAAEGKAIAVATQPAPSPVPGQASGGAAGSPQGSPADLVAAEANLAKMERQVREMKEAAELAEIERKVKKAEEDASRRATGLAPGIPAKPMSVPAPVAAPMVQPASPVVNPVPAIKPQSNTLQVNMQASPSSMAAPVAAPVSAPAAVLVPATTTPSSFVASSQTSGVKNQDLAAVGAKPALYMRIPDQQNDRPTLRKVSAQAGQVVSQAAPAVQDQSRYDPMVYPPLSANGSVGIAMSVQAAIQVGYAPQTKWEIRKEDGTLRNALERFAQRAGHTLSFQARDVALVKGGTFFGTFDEAMREIEVATNKHLQLVQMHDAASVLTVTD